MDTGLTTEIIQQLSAPFEPHEYGIRVGAKNEKYNNVMWLVYVEEDAIVDRLNAVAPNWTWDIRNVQSGEGYIAAYGRLTVNGVSREGVGTGSPDKGTKIGENEEKGAATDALKRCARLFGIGLELKREDIGRVYTDGLADDKNAKAQALAKFTAAYNKVFGGKPSSRPAPVQRQAVQPAQQLAAPGRISDFRQRVDDIRAEQTPGEIIDAALNDEPPSENPFKKTKRDHAYDATSLRHNYGHRRHFDKLMELLQREDKVHVDMTVDELVAVIDAHYAAKALEKVTA